MKNIIIVLLVVVVLLLGGYILFGEQISTDNNGQMPENKESSEKEPQAGDRLDLSGQNLEKIPEYVFSMTGLEELDVSNNKLTGAIQAEIRHLKNLKVLNASNNLMTGVPAEIGQLNNLEVLDLSNNQLTGLPYELGNLNNLKTFNISGNNYSELDLNIIKENLPDSVDIIVF